MHINVYISCTQLSAQRRSSGNPFFSILNVLGILGSGVLAALFVSKKKEKATSDATLEYVSNLNGYIFLFCGIDVRPSMLQNESEG